MRIVFMGCVEFSRTMLMHLLSSVPNTSIVGVITRRSSPRNADFCSLEDIANTAQIPCHIAEGNNQSGIMKWLQGLAPDVMYCFGWSYLLERQILKVPRLGVVGYHPAALPQNRGRHPIIWALALGLPETASTFFFMDEGADSGDILSQEFVSIGPADDAADLYRKLSVTAIEQVTCFTGQLVENTYSRKPQDHSKANYWRKRNKLDGQIDWRMSARNIYNLIRALAPPYLGAHCVHNGTEIKIWKSELAGENPQNLEPGKVIKVIDKNIFIACGEGILKLVGHDFTELPAEGSYL